MQMAFTPLRARRVENARAFARGFNRFEWKDLCAYRTFLALVDQGLDTGDFFPAQRRAEAILLKDRPRKPARPASPLWPNYSLDGDIHDEG